MILAQLDGARGFKINGIGVQDFSGRSVGHAGDINGDGFDDIVIGAHGVDVGELSDAGEAYVLFGHAPPYPAKLELAELDGKNGFVLSCGCARDYCGVSVSGAANLNDDGFDDVIVGVPFGDPQGKNRAGMTYVVFGHPEVGSSGRIALAELDGSDGFVINGSDVEDYSGWQVSRAGDINGDGIDDIAIGASFADPDGRQKAGKAYAIFGRADIGSDGAIELASLDGTNGFVMHGFAAYDNLGRAATAAGDLNDDGVDDLAVSSFLASPDGKEWAGETYIIFGRASDTDGDAIPDRIDNCTALANPDQRDTNGDGYGNLCDPDLDDNGIVNFGDLGLLKSVFFGSNPDGDFNGDGTVNFLDLGTMKAFFLLPPGPSGQVDAQRRAERRPTR